MEADACCAASQGLVTPAKRVVIGLRRVRATGHPACSRHLACSVFHIVLPHICTRPSRSQRQDLGLPPRTPSRAPPAPPSDHFYESLCRMSTASRSQRLHPHCAAKHCTRHSQSNGCETPHLQTAAGDDWRMTTGECAGAGGDTCSCAPRLCATFSLFLSCLCSRTCTFFAASSRAPPTSAAASRADRD
jgi:hypothetical protein